MFPEKMRELVARFEFYKQRYLRSNYLEAQVRNEFIDYLFISLDWDVRNDSGKAIEYQDVMVEYALGGKRADYAFRMGGTVCFLVEAKRPGISLKDMSADQVGGYTDHEREKRKIEIPFSLLTDFEEFVIFADVRGQYEKVFYCTYQEYEKYWRLIYSLFSYRAVSRGNLFRISDRLKSSTRELTSSSLTELLSRNPDLFLEPGRGQTENAARISDDVAIKSELMEMKQLLKNQTQLLEKLTSPREIHERPESFSGDERKKPASEKREIWTMVFEDFFPVKKMPPEIFHIGPAAN